MTTQNKVDGLNNLETIYDEVIAYNTAFLHDSAYYQIAHDASTYFSSSTDGPDSGFVAYTIDGQSYSQIAALATPSGVIGIWSGSIASIPSGWVLCNGMNGTPDLRSYFLVGAGATGYDAGAHGGYDSVTPTGSVTIATTALSAEHIPAHTHGWVDTSNYNGGSGGGNSGPFYDTCDIAAVLHNAYTDYAGSGTAHGHSGSTAILSPIDNRPVYYSKAYIMRL